MNGQPSHEELRERDASFDACFHRVEVPRQFCRRQVGAFSFAARRIQLDCLGSTMKIMGGRHD